MISMIKTILRGIKLKDEESFTTPLGKPRGLTG